MRRVVCKVWVIEKKVWETHDGVEVPTWAPTSYGAIFTDRQYMLSELKDVRSRFPDKVFRLKTYVPTPEPLRRKL